jgi:hypothetical protein
MPQGAGGTKTIFIKNASGFGTRADGTASFSPKKKFGELNWSRCASQVCVAVSVIEKTSTQCSMTPPLTAHRTW